MSDVSIGIKFTADGKQLVGEVAAASAAVDKLGASAQRAQSQAQQFAKTNEAWRQNMAGVTAAMRETSSASIELSRDTQRILDRYDPLGTKLRALQSDMSLLRKEMGNSTTDAAIKGFQGLEAEIDKTRTLMGQAGGAVDGHGKSMGGLGLNTQYARRELMMLGREALTGDFSQMPRTFGSLVTHSNLLPALLNPITLGVVALAGAGIGLGVAYAKGREEMDAMNNALAVTNNYSGLTRGGMESLSASVAANGHITIGTSKDIVTALVASGRIGAESIGTIANLTSNYAKATGQDISKIAPEMVKLFADPLKGAEELNRQMHFLSVTDMEHIRTLEQLGKTQEAQLFLAQKVTGHMPQQEANLGTLSKAWHGMAKAISMTADALMSVGKTNSAEMELAGAQQRYKMGESPEARAARLKPYQDAVVAIKAQTAATNEAARANEAESRAQGAEARAANQTEIAFQEKLNESTLRYSASNIDAQFKLGKISLQQHDAQMLGNALEMNASKQLFETQMMHVKGLTAEQKKQHANNLTLLQEEAGKIANDGKNKLLLDEKKLADEKLKQYADIQKSVESLGKTEIASLDRSIAAQQLHNAEIGKTPEQIALIKAGIDDLAIKQNEAELGALNWNLQYVTMEPEIRQVLTTRAAKLDEIIARQKTLRDGYVTGAALEAENAANKKRLADFKQFSNEIDRSLTDALMRGFQHGESFGQNFVKSLENTLKTAALKVVVQAMVNPIMGGVQGAFSGVSASGVASGGGALGYLNAGQIIWSGFSGGMAASGASLASSLGFTNFAAGMRGATLGAGIAGPTTAGAAGAMGAGSAVATAMPYIAAAMVAYSLFGGSKGTPTQNLGMSSTDFNAQGTGINRDQVFASTAGSDAVVANLQSSYLKAAMELGIGTAAHTFSYASNTGKDSKDPRFGLGGVAGLFSAGADNQSLTQQNLELASARAVFAALQGSQLPGYLSKVFDGLTASSMNQQQITDTLAFAQSLKQLRDGLAETRTPLEIAQAQMTSLSAEFHTSATAFKTDLIAAIDAGIEPSTIARWQSLGQAIDQVTAYQEQAAQAAADLAQTQARAAADLAQEQARAAADLAQEQARAAADLAQAQARATADALSQAQQLYDQTKSNLVNAYTRESDAAQQLADNMRGFAASFSSLRTSLNLGNLSTLSGSAKYQEAQRQFDDVSRRAKLGDTTALNDLAGVSQSFLQASKDYNASSVAYANDFARVDATLQASGEVAARQADISIQQVSLLRGQIDALGLINTSVLSIAAALKAYQTASGGLSAAGGHAYQQFSAADYQAMTGMTSSQQLYDSIVANNFDLYAVGRQGGHSAAAIDQWAKDSNINRVPGFAAGGDHAGGLRIVGERGIELEATGPSRIFNAEQTRQMLGGGDNKETNALLKEVVTELRAIVRQGGAVATATVAKLEIVADKLDANKRELARAA